jgi:hypothetical protein
MAGAVEVSVHVAGLKQFKEFIRASGEVVAAYDDAVIRGEAPAMDLGVAIGVLRIEMLRLAGDDT